MNPEIRRLKQIQRAKIKRTVAQSPQAIFLGQEPIAEPVVAIRHHIDNARSSGTLKLTNMGLEKVPEAVWRIHEPNYDAKENHSFESGGLKWWEQSELTRLFISSNKIECLSEGLGNLTGLETLEIQDNELSTLPEEFGLLKKLNRLVAARNKLQRLPDAFGYAGEIGHLNLSFNSLERFPHSFQKMRGLQFVLATSGLLLLTVHRFCMKRIDTVLVANSQDLKNNRLREFPSYFGGFTLLTSLDLTHNCLTEVPVEVGLMRSLQFLGLSNNKIAKLPETIGELCELKILHVGHNRLTEFPKVTPKLKDVLKEVNLEANSISKIPRDISMCIHLTTVSLKDNRIGELPEEIGEMKSLKKLDVAGNNLTTIPPTLALLENLNTLRVDGNPIRTIKREILQAGTKEILALLKTRLAPPENEDKVEPMDVPDSSSTQATSAASRTQAHARGKFTSKISVPAPVVNAKWKDIETLSQTKTLKVNNLLKPVDELKQGVFEISAAANVVEVDLAKNKLDVVPEGLKLLTSVSVLRFANNRLSQVPDWFADLRKITILDLSSNCLTSLPLGLSGLPLLRELNISYNRFAALPEPVTSCSELEVLLIGGNQLTEIDVEKLKSLTKLAQLDLSNNSIKSVPPQLGTMTQLNLLKLEGNLFRQPRHDILSRGTDFVMKYLRDKIPV